MKHRMTPALLLLCCMLLCGCGRKQNAETAAVTAPAPAVTAEPAATPEPARPPMTEAEQRVLIEHSRSTWLPAERTAETWFYTVCDLDHNGRLEVMTASLQGTGLYTWVDVWEVNETCTGLSSCPDDTREGEAWPDIIRDTLSCWYDAASGRYTYVCEDLMRDGAARYLTSVRSFCLKDGRIEVKSLGTMEEVYTSENSSTKNYYDGNGSPVTEQTYSTAVDRTFSGQEGGSILLAWTQLEPESADPVQQTFAFQPQAAVQPQMTAQPQTAGPVTVTKNPTSETLAAGGRTWFIAHADNATSLTWLLTSPQGQTYSMNEAMTANPGLVLQALEEDTLAVSNVPASVDGWSVQARFDGPGGSAVTSPAMIYIEDYVSSYGSVISNYYRVYTAGNNTAEYAFSSGMSEFIDASEHVGYALRDLNGDGTPELLIAGIGANESAAKVLYEVCTLGTEGPVQLACSSARNRYYLLPDGRILNEGSGGAGHSVLSINVVQDTKLAGVEAILTNFDGGERDGYYHQTDGISEYVRDYDAFISEQDFQYLMDQWESAVCMPELTLIA